MYGIRADGIILGTILLTADVFWKMEKVREEYNLEWEGHTCKEWPVRYLRDSSGMT